MPIPWYRLDAASNWTVILSWAAGAFIGEYVRSVLGVATAGSTDMALQPLAAAYAVAYLYGSRSSGDRRKPLSIGLGVLAFLPAAIAFSFSPDVATLTARTAAPAVSAGIAFLLSARGR